MKTRHLSMCFLSAVFLCSCGGGEKQKVQNTAAEPDKIYMYEAQELFEVLPTEATSDSNKITPEKVLLGKTLFYDNRLSKNNTVSCNSCHNLSTYGVDNKPLSKGDLEKDGKRNTPTVYNAALFIAQFWDGSARSVEAQVAKHILNPSVMNMPTADYVIARLKKIEGYKKLFVDAYPNESEAITFNNLKNAIGAFERTLITPSDFDRFIGGDVRALSEAEQKGLHEFIEVGCTTCHVGKTLGGGMMQKFPLYGTEYKSLTGSTHDDYGKMEFTKDTMDKFTFKVPTLINVTETAPYFHDGSGQDLDKVIPIMAKLELKKELTTEQVASIKLFLGSLKGNLPQAAITAPELPQ